MLETSRLAKSESRETTFDRDLRGLEQLEPVLERLTGELCATLAAAGAARPHDRDQGPARGLLDRHPGALAWRRATADRDTVWPVARDLLRRLEPAMPVRLLGVRVAGLDEGRRDGPAAPDDQLSLSL